MASWASASVAYFLYIGAVAAFLPRLGTAARLRVAAVAVVGLGVSLAGGQATAFWARSLIWPPVALLLAYWATGLVWTGPMPRIEAWLSKTDDRLKIPAIVARTPRAFILILEGAYAGVYPIIPIALVLHLWFSPDADADRFWLVVLITDFVCFGMLPWIQTRPPRAVEAVQPWSSGLRSFNVSLLGRLSIGVNTVPSGHAAEALAAALLLSDAPAGVAVWMWAAAAAISAGAVLGRYHYAVDAFAGWAVALIVWTAL